MKRLAISNQPTREDFRELLRLGSPIILIQIGIMAMGVVDTLMVGRISATALAAVALANLYTIGWSILGLGVLISRCPRRDCRPARSATRISPRARADRAYDDAVSRRRARSRIRAAAT